MIRRHLSYANITATLALVFAMSGGALAATHYIITSRKQIKPSVLKTLKGTTGKNGANGPAGATGPQGPQGTPGTAGTNGEKGAEGKQGPPGTTGWVSTLPAGATETGTWSIGNYPAGNEVALAALSFSIPLAKSLSETHVHYIKAEETAPTGCTGGSNEHPTAEEGNLCIYVDNESGHVNEKEIKNPEIGSIELGAGKTGAIIYAEVEPEGRALGTWATTAP